MDEFSKEQKELYSKPCIYISPAFNDEWTIEVYDIKGELLGRYHAADSEVAVRSIEAALIDPSPRFEVN